jgi:hypothetical protein
MLQRTPEVLLLAGITALFLATGTAHADSLEAYRKAACETAEDFAGCVANKKPQMFAADTIRWDCRHGFTLSSDDTQSGMIRDEEVEFITTIVKTPTYKACKAYTKCLTSGKEKHCYKNDKRWRGFHTDWW